MQREYRLKNNASFSYIYKNGDKQKSSIINLFYVNASNIKVGISVSKKIGNSVVRSLVKRRIKESFRQLIPSITARCNYVVVAKEGIQSASYQQIDAELTKTLKRIGHLPKTTNV